MLIDFMKIKVTICLLFIIAQSSFIYGQIVFNGSTTGSGSGVSTLTYAKTISAGNNRLIYVGVTTQDKGITSVTWNGLALTQFTIGTRNSMRVAMYYRPLGSSASPTTANVVVTLASSTDCFSGAADYSGVWQSPSLMNPTVAQAKSTTPSVTFGSFVGHKAISLMGDIAANPTANGAGQTQYWSFSGSHSNRSTEKAGAASVTMSHTISANEDWVMIGATMVDYAVALPVEVLSFEGERVDKNVLLKWSTSAEVNNDFFTVERSVDGINFESLGDVDGAGNSLTALNYSFVDDKPKDGVSYYRLKQTDFNLNTKYSNIVAIDIKNVEIMNFFPNPSTSQSNVIVNSPEDMSVLFNIVGSEGKVLRNSEEKLQKGLNIIKLDVANFAEGSYFFSIINGNNVLSKKQFLVK